MVWRKSSYSGGQSNCVEVRLARAVAVRDTKAREHGHLTVSRAAWVAAVSALRG
ncbi:DUF397 domain-containing protein [Amycolatopsis rifamycinica]|uniref:DUF397 domain-containing protein n=1 Tax=Amycolatopsis rifamycinica TaxID=287986 RepID=UPI00190F99CB|nr:DUF397 domain-containing protein [Amycolatopsis rifamycinica]